MDRHVKPISRTCHHRVYRLDCDDYEELRRHNNYCCWICDKHESTQPTEKLCIDHDTMIGRWAVRGLLCNGCNGSVKTGWACDVVRRKEYLDNPWYWRNGRVGEPIWRGGWVFTTGPIQKPADWPWEDKKPKNYCDIQMAEWLEHRKRYGAELDGQRQRQFI